MTRSISLITIMFFSVTLLMSCNSTGESKPATSAEQPSLLTPTQKQGIEKEISAITRSFFQHVEKLEIEGCMSVFENATDFLAANPDGTSADFNTLKKINGEGFSQMSSFSSVLNKESVRVLSASHVLYTFFATQEFTLKTGEKMKMENVAGTMLFSRINNSWKATFYHESGAQPVNVSPDK